ncbi:MAG: M48 family metallopeptidase [Bacteroidetes bacterium]|nr:M48 family metallopeptidase [Bacteroidota bacterium]
MKKILIPIITLAVLSSACEKNAITGRRSLNLVPESEMMTMSFSQYDQFLTENKPLPDTDKNVQLVRSVGKKIQAAVEKYYNDKGLSSQLAGYQWTFNVVQSAEVNAWCMPGGKVVVYTGLLPVTQDEPSLAVVMGHEIAHAVARHGNERMSQGLLVQYGGEALSSMLQTKPQVTQELFKQSFGIGSQLGLLKFSRTDETEADKMGVVFMALAGYNPEAALPFWERMAQASSGQKPPEILSTHPSDETRIATLKAFMPEAKKYYTGK